MLKTLQWGGGGKASYSQNKASSLARIRAIHVDGKKDLIPVCASCHYPDQAATTSLQDHIPKLKTIYLYPYQLIQFNQKPKDTTAIDIAHKESHESN
ncbi:hypothetical protein [Helicobacter muridarum]|uniref:hypothetical protein n=1 Tax=Helicobacter muridarum TaxID=216 RepID=UPI000CF050FA|nr:hypothetical protein [Helicobacter muridarum]